MEARQLKSLIKDRGIKKNYIAEKLSVSNGLITQWINGSRPIPQRHIPGLRKIFFIN
jgi:transcriptional regulator with XRE-family HTH domain